MTFKISTSWVAGITSVNHQTWLQGNFYIGIEINLEHIKNIILARDGGAHL
jgi:hypothetical protein